MPLWPSIIRLLLLMNHSQSFVNNKSNQARITQYFNQQQHQNKQNQSHENYEYIQCSKYPYRCKLDDRGNLILLLPNRKPIPEKYVDTELAFYLSHEQNKDEEKEQYESDISIDNMDENKEYLHAEGTIYTPYDTNFINSLDRYKYGADNQHSNSDSNIINPNTSTAPIQSIITNNFSPTTGSPTTAPLNPNNINYTQTNNVLDLPPKIKIKPPDPPKPPPPPPPPPPPSTTTNNSTTNNSTTNSTPNNVVALQVNIRTIKRVNSICDLILCKNRLERTQSKNSWNNNDDNLCKSEIDKLNLALATYPELGLLPKRSVIQYLRTFKQFIFWMDVHNVSLIEFDKYMGRVFCQGLTAHFKYSSCWSLWSRIKACMRSFFDIECDEWTGCKRIIKYHEKDQRAQGIIAKQAPLFAWDDIFYYMTFEDDTGVHISRQSMVIIGGNGRMRASEYLLLFHGGIESLNDGSLRFSYLKPKSKQLQSFIVTGDVFVNKLKEYFAITKPLWTAEGPHKGAVFWKCAIDQNGIGHPINDIPNTEYFYSRLTREIALYLGYENWQEFTGHSICHSFSNFLANSGLSLAHMMRWGGWNSKNVPLSYIHNNITNKKMYAQMISNPEFINNPNVITTNLTTTTHPKKHKKKKRRKRRHSIDENRIETKRNRSH